MARSHIWKDRLDELRRRAEKALKSRDGDSQDPLEFDLIRLLHELEVHHVKLELQNEELRSARDALEQSGKRYADLYQHAPVGCLDISPEGFISRANIAARQKLGILSPLPSNIQFSQFIHADDREKFRDLMRRVARGDDGKGTCTLRTVGKDEARSFIQLELAAAFDPERKLTGWRLVFVDITERKRAEGKLLGLKNHLRVELEAMKRLQKIGSLFAKEGAVEPVLDEIVEAAVAISGADFGAVQLLDSRSSNLRVVSQQGFPSWWADCWNKVCKGRGACCAVLNRNKRTIVQGVEESRMLAGTPALELMRKAGIRTVQCTPLVSRTATLIGVFSTYYRAKKRLDGRTLRLLGILARQTATIVERAQMVGELKRSEERFRALAQASSDAIYQIAPNWEALHRLFGRDAEGDPNENWLQNCIHPDDRTAMSAKIREAVRNRSTFEHEYRFRNPDGGYGWRFARAIPLLDENGNIFEWFGAASDITQRKLAEDALRESEERFRVAQELSPDGFTILRPVRDEAGDVVDFTWIYENPAIARMRGAEPKEVVGRRVLEVFPHHRESSFFAAYLQVVRTGATCVLEDFFDGKHLLKPTWFRVAVVRMAGSGDIAILAQDITEHKQMEVELERRVIERTASLEAANEQLRLVPSKLIEVQENESKRLASELHDSIGQTLAALKFRIEHISSLVRNGKAEEAANLLDQFVPILQRSIDETRTIYMGLKPAVLADNGFLAALEWYRRQLMGVYTKIHIELEMGVREEDIPEGLKIAMFRIAQEALNNSCKHSGAEWIDARITEGAGKIELEISDDGKGMELDYVLKTASAKSLGLLGMKERAEISGGKFFMESAPGEGARVRALWPVQIPGEVFSGQN